MSLSGEEQIYNEALGYIGEYKVEDTAASRLLKQYLLCKRYYEKSRDMALASHPWKEASKPVILIQDTVPPLLKNYDRKYPKPGDCLRVLSVDDDLGADLRNNAQGVDNWEIEGEYILSNAGVSPPTWSSGTKYYTGEYVDVTPDTWSSGTAYIVGQYVKSGTTVYEVLIAHTSGTLATDITNGKLVSWGTGSTAVYEVMANHTSDTVTNDISAGNINASGDRVDYRIVYVRYVWKLTDTTKFSTHLKEAIAVQFASKIITGLTNDTKGKVDLINEFENLTSPKARSIDSAQRKPKPIFNSQWVRSRQAGTQVWP